MGIRMSLRVMALAVGVAAALAVSACAGDRDGLEERVAAIEAETAVTRAALAGLDETLRTANMIAAMGVLNQVEFHHVDVTVQGYKEVDLEFLSTLRNARRVTRAAVWPHAAAVRRRRTAAAIEDTEAVFEAEDLAALKTAAAAAHDRFHTLESDVNALMDGGEPKGHHGGDDDDDDDRDEDDDDRDEDDDDDHHE